MQILKDKLKLINMNAFCLENTGSVNEGRTVDLFQQGFQHCLL